MLPVLATGEFLALEAEIQTLTQVRERLVTAGGFDMRIAMEADALMGSSDLTRLAFERRHKSEKLRVALEGIGARIWEAIKAFFKKIGEWIRKAIDFLFGKRGVSEEKVKEFEQTAEEFEAGMNEFNDGLQQMTREVHADNTTDDLLKEAIASFESGMSGPIKAVISGGPGVLSPYNKAVLHLVIRMRDDPVQMVGKRLRYMEEWLEKAWQVASKYDADVDGLSSPSNSETVTDAINHLKKVNDAAIRADYSHDVGRGLLSDPELVKEEIKTIGDIRSSPPSNASGSLRGNVKIVTRRIAEILEDAYVKLGGNLDKTLAEFKRLGANFDKFKDRLENKLKEAQADQQHAAREKVVNLLMDGCRKFAEEVQLITAALMTITTHYRDSLDAVLALQKMLIETFGKALSHTDVKGTKFAAGLEEKLGRAKAAHAEAQKIRASI
ncbi:hypothetical protein [Paraburkholderia sp. BCC1886]|uniref:hypothetical protein n=1 Tax=Paraburkholderia sp. BCC1886 TaxID=2562670 RepID=UPI0011841660|nr:hypothetical protein [Paraburkholderia sp. BCC1886]